MSQKPRRKCWKCKSDSKITVHHVFPRRHFRRKKMWKKRGKTIPLCRNCHNELEKIIPMGGRYKGRLSAIEYIMIASEFTGIDLFYELDLEFYLSK